MVSGIPLLADLGAILLYLSAFGASWMVRLRRINKEEVTLTFVLSHQGRGRKEKVSAEVTTIGHSRKSEEAPCALPT
uniref:Uncharacterized protein n=1 Tax=candidate division WOR-3 bacterium TaxID=2052148 RepID=A0A7C6EBS7_UNCW3